MKLTVFSVGKDRSGLFSPGVDEYVQRLRWRAGLASFLARAFVFVSGDPAEVHRELREDLGF